MAVIYLEGGCFWGLQELFRTQFGVIDTVVGYTGGTTDYPTFEHHSGHSEALKINFDPKLTSYRQLLDFFFRIHDPTTLNRQGNDVGTSYRSVIFYDTDEQKQLAQAMIKQVDVSKLYEGRTVTAVEKLKHFWPAEDYHQNYLQKNPGGYTCHYIRQTEPLA